MAEELRYCKCGCGERVKNNKNVYIRGHNTSRKLIDITGEIHRDFKVVRRATTIDLDNTGVKIHNGSYWWVKCIHCGFEKISGRRNFLSDGIDWCKCIKDRKREEKKLIEYGHEIGKKYNQLLVIDVVCRYSTNRGWTTQLKCQCDCGNIKTDTVTKIKSGGVKSCGCLKYKVKIGDTFNSLKIIGKESNTKNGQCRWLCKCVCGEHRIVSTNSLISNKAKTCIKCLRKKQKEDRIKSASEKMIGKRFNNLVVIKIDSWKNNKLYYLCQCDCGETRIAPRDKLVCGRTKSCGCLNKLYSGDKKENQNGYVLIYLPDRKSPKARDGRILEHVYMMEKKLGRSLKEHENIHHKNGIRNDNRIENLELWTRKHPPGQRVEDMQEWMVDYLIEHSTKDGLNNIVEKLKVSL